MTIWLQKEFAFGDYGDAQTAYTTPCLKLQHPREMMMVITVPLGHRQVYLSLPTEDLSHLFPGWVKIEESNLPLVASGLVSHQDEFEKRFRYPV